MITNKKAILGMLVAMVMSLGVMSGINKNSSDSNVQQVGAVCAYISGETEGGVSSALSYAADWCGAASAGAAAGGVIAAAVSTTNPIGWGFWVGVGCVAL